MGPSYAITQDQQGYIWFSSFCKGLVRYNGKEFKSFKHEPENPNSLASNDNHLNSGGFFRNDLAGNLWIRT